MDKQKVVIIGAWFGWLGSAILMARAWYDVTVVEQNDKPWWRANLLQRDGYTWDMWPSWYLMPDAFERYFHAIGRRVEEYLDLQKLEPSYRVFFKPSSWEGTTKEPIDSSLHSEWQAPYLDLYADVEKTAQQFEKIEEGSGDKLRNYLSSAADQYDIAMNKFVFKNVDSIREVMKPEMAKDGMKLNIFSSLYNYVSRFVKTENLKKILMYPSVFLGTSPYQTPALFNIMSHVDFNQWVFYPQGGIHEIPKALYQIALEEGVEFRFGAKVEEIVVEDKKVSWVQIWWIIMPASIIISNADMRHTETQLLETKYQTYPESYRAKKVISPSGFILYLWVDGELPQLQHHTLIFNDDWKEWFAQVFSKPKWPDDPSYYICNPSKTDPSVAPVGKENLFVLVPIAPGLESTPESLQAYADFILSDISKTCGIPDLAERIEVQQIFSIPQFEQYYNAYKWTALGLAHTMFQSAFRRPNNYSKKVKWLYYAGGYTTPGIGMPMCLISAMMVAERIEKNA